MNQLTMFDTAVPEALAKAPKKTRKTAVNGAVTFKPQRIEPYVLGIIKRCRVEGNRVHITDGDLDRDTYLKVDEVFTRLLGKFKGRKGKGGAHVFPFDMAEMITAVVETGLMPDKNPMAYFPTPEPVIEDVLEWSDVKFLIPRRILEPGAGQGAFALHLAEMFPKAALDVCEIQAVNRSILRSKGFNLVGDDFLQYRPDGPYDLIVMNPPFSTPDDSNAYVTHIMHAWEMLEPAGKLVAITPMGWTFHSSGPQKAFRKFVYDFGQYETFDAGAFSKSGTDVDTAVVWMDKPVDGKSWRRKPYNSYNSNHSFELDLMLSNNEKWSNRYHALLKEIKEGGQQVIDLIGMPLGHLREELVALFDEVETECNRDCVASIFLEDEDINFLLLAAVRDADEV